MSIIQKQYDLAKAEDRLCKRCGWIVTKKFWKAGHRICANCYDAMAGVKPKRCAYPDSDEPSEKTGEMP